MKFEGDVPIMFCFVSHSIGSPASHKCSIWRRRKSQIIFSSKSWSKIFWKWKSKKSWSIFFFFQLKIIFFFNSRLFFFCGKYFEIWHFEKIFSDLRFWDFGKLFWDLRFWKNIFRFWKKSKFQNLRFREKNRDFSYFQIFSKISS